MKNFVKLSFTLVLAVLTLTGCNCFKKMAKNLDLVEVKCTPEVLELNNGKVKATFAIKFPADYFNEKAIAKVTPVIVYEGGEVAGTPFFYQGAKVEDNYKVITDGATETVEFDYTPAMRLSNLQLRVEVKCKDEFELINLNTGAVLTSTEKATVAADAKSAESLAILSACGYNIAKGVNTLQQDFSFRFGNTKSAPKAPAKVKENAKSSAASSGKAATKAASSDGFVMVNMPADYKRVTNSTEKSDLMYTIGSSVVASKASKSEAIQAFVALIDETHKNERATQKLSVQGYASPDGPEKFNDKLSKSRSESAKKAMEKLLKEYNLSIDAASYGEDWDGFKELVEKSNIEDKNLILQVLNLYTSSTQREDEIKNMAAVFTALKSEVLPQLRRTKVVNDIELIGKSDEEMTALVKESKFSEMTIEELLHVSNDVISNNKLRRAALEYAVANSSNPAADNNLGVVYAMLSQYDKAKASFENASKNGAPAKTINKNLSLLALAQGDLEAAEKYSGDTDKKTKAVVAASKGDYTQAAKELSGYNKAVACVMMGDYATAKTAIAKDKSASADYLRAVIASKEGDLNVAGTQLKSAVGKDSTLAKKSATDVNLSPLFESGFKL